MFPITLIRVDKVIANRRMREDMAFIGVDRVGRGGDESTGLAFQGKILGVQPRSCQKAQRNHRKNEAKDTNAFHECSNPVPGGPGGGADTKRPVIQDFSNF